MNKYSGTCYLSRLPIKENDEIAVIILAETCLPKQEHGKSINQNFDIFGRHVIGQYDGHGGIKNIERTDDYLKFLQVQPIYISKEPGIYRKSRGFKTAETFISTVMTSYESNVEYAVKTENPYFRDSRDDYAYRYCRLSAIMVHKNLYKNLIKECGSRKIIMLTKSSDICYKDYLVGRIISMCQQRTDRTNDFTKEIFQMRNKQFLIKQTTLALVYSEIKDNGNVTSIDSTFEYLFSRLENIGINKKNPAVQIDKEHIISDIVHIILFNDVMDFIRSGYYALSSDGCIWNEMIYQKIVAEFTLNYIQNCIQSEKDKDSGHFKDEYYENLLKSPKVVI